MNFKACCGLLSSNKDDEDHDYEDVEQEPLPKPRPASDLPPSKRQQQRSSAPSIYAAAGYSAKAVSIRALEEDLEPERTTVRRPAPPSLSGFGASAEHERLQQEEHHLPTTMEPLKRKSNFSAGGRRAGSFGGGGGQATGRSSSRSSPSGAGGSQEYAADFRGGGGVRARPTTVANTEAMRPAPKGAVGTEMLAGREPTGNEALREGLKKAGIYSSQAAAAVSATPTAVSPVKPKFDLNGFVEMLEGGLIVTKINRQGRAKVRTLFYNRQDEMLWWNEPGSGSRRPGSASSLLSIRKEQPLPVESLIKVNMADQLNEPFCLDEDVDKSFQLVFPARTVDLVAKDAEEAALLARGFQELKVYVSARK